MFQLEPLSGKHDRAGFDCGNEPLNRYLQQTALQHESKDLGRTYVLIEKNTGRQKIVGYFTLNYAHLSPTILPPILAKKLPRQTEAPAMRLARLAVAHDRQRQGIGHFLIAAALKKVEIVEKIVGGIGLFVDAKDEPATAYYAQFGFVPLGPAPLTLFLPVQDIRKFNALAR